MRLALTLAELEAFASFGTTRFLAFNLAGIARHESFGFQSGFVFGVDFYECAGYGQTQSFGLS